MRKRRREALRITRRQNSETRISLAVEELKGVCVCVCVCVCVIFFGRGMRR